MACSLSRSRCSCSTFDVPAAEFADLWSGIAKEWPSYLAFATSFTTIGGIWLAHHAMMRRSPVCESRLMQINLLLLMAVSFLPFPTKLVAEAIRDPDAERAAVIFYGACLLVIQILLASMWIAVSRDRSLLQPEVTDKEVNAIMRAATPSLGFYAGVIVLAFVAPKVAAFGYLVIAVMAVMRARGDQINAPATAPPELAFDGKPDPLARGGNPCRSREARSLPQRGRATGSPVASSSTPSQRRRTARGCSASNVHFTPGARTAWHTHPNGQTIWVTEGIGHAQRRGGPIEVIRPGDRVFFEPGEEHWHGAAATRFMVHVAMLEVDGRETTRSGATTSPTTSTRRHPRSTADPLAQRMPASTEKDRRPCVSSGGDSYRASLGASHALALADRYRRADERQVSECLGEVPELPAGHGVVLLGEEPDVVPEIQQPLEELARLVVLALQGEYLGQPERAREKHALTRR